ncbi:ITA10 protein, partial [Zosterops hypoxanthus]|nr:ITA10 protein [Zosterops hypoxanthus]
SDSTEVTPQDNVVEISVPILYQPNLFLSSNTNLHRYEVHPLGTFSHNSGPEFTTRVKVQNLGCYPVQNVTLHMALPALGQHRATILSVNHVLAENVSVGDTERPFGVVFLLFKPFFFPPQASCVLKSPNEEGTGVVPVSPEDLQDVER